MSEAMITRRGGGGGSSRLQSKAVSITEAPTTIIPDSGYDGMSTVTVDIAAESQIAATSYTPGTQAQTIAANKWLAGAQTIQGDANLLATNIKKGVSIFGIAGAYEAALDTNSAILKVVTSTGCSVTVTNGTDTFTQQDAEGFVRTGDANVTEHFFVIPTAAFGTFSVTSTHPTYGNNTKTNAVTIGNAGKVYEVLCGGRNVILNSTFGLQSGYLLQYGYANYSEINKTITMSSEAPYNTLLLTNIPVRAYSELTLTAIGWGTSGHEGYIFLRQDGVGEIANAGPFTASESGTTVNITGAYYETANLLIDSIRTISEIILT